MARHPLPRKAKRSPLAAAGSGSGSGRPCYNNPPNQRPASAAFFPAADEGPSHGSSDGAASNGRSQPPSRQRLLFCGAVVLLSSVLAALYHLAVTLPDQYSHAGGALYHAGQHMSLSTSKQTAKMQPKDTAAKVAWWSSLPGLGGRGGAGSRWQRQMAQELATFESLYNERAAERRTRTTPPPRTFGVNSASTDDDADAIGKAGGGENQWEVEAALGRTRYPHTHAVQSSSRTGLLPKRGRSVRRRYDQLRKKMMVSDGGNATPPSQLCGTHAQAAASRHGTSYALSPLTSRSRVLITGIVSTSVGYRLALHLARHCHVSAIIGLDNLYPNTIEHRLELSERMGRLHHALREGGTELVGGRVWWTYVGVDQILSQGSRGDWPISNLTGELEYGAKYRPTHIVHLAGMKVEGYRDVLGSRGRSRAGSRSGGRVADNDDGDGDEARAGGRLNGASPYVADDGAGRIPPLYALRQRMVGMEHLLQNIVTWGRRRKEGGGVGPHFLYASVLPLPPARARGASEEATAASSDKRECPPEEDATAFHRTAGAIEEALATKYSHSDGVYSVGLRLPASIYGPMAGRPGVATYDVVEAAVGSWGEVAAAAAAAASATSSAVALKMGDRLLNQTGHGNSCVQQRVEQSYLHVDDAVDVIVAAMQYHRRTGEAVVFDVPARKDSTVTLQGFAEAVVSIAKTPVPDEKQPPSALSFDGGRRTTEYLAWSPSIPFFHGIVSQIAWHWDRRQPFGPPSNVDTDGSIAWRKSFRGTSEEQSHEPPRGRKFPCSSECARSFPCTESVFDAILPLTRELTDGCDLVFYSSTWNATITDLPIETNYLRNSSYYPEMCNIAFVPRESSFVHTIVSNVSESVLKSLKVATKPGPLDDRIDALNGRLLHKGWILVFVGLPSVPIDSATKNLLKLSPRRLFASSVTKGVYVNGVYTKPAKSEDALFLSTFLRRDATKAKIYIRQGDNGKTYKIPFPAYPRRRAMMVAPVMRHPTLMVNATVDPTPNIGIKTAVKVMLLEAGLDPSDPASLPSHLRHQLDHYQYVASVINRKELRSTFEPNYLYESRHWISSKTLVHDFTREEGRQLRCELYEEHSLWGTEYDALSFSHVMATRTLRRQLHRDEPDAVAAKSRREKMTESDIVKERLVNGIVDWHQWHSLVSEGEKAGRVQSPPSTENVIEDLLRVKRLLPERDVRNADYHVRIFLPQTSTAEREEFDRMVGRLLPKTHQLKDFYRGSRKIYAV